MMSRPVASRKCCVRRLPAVLAAALLCAAAVPAADTSAAAGRRDALIESLNGPSDRRPRILEAIYAELRGADGQEMHELLRQTLLRSNSLILQGAAEALAMYGDPDDLSALEALLATTARMEVKTRIVRLLPAFCLTGSERARFAYIRYAAGYERTEDPAVLGPLRRLPLTRRGRLDPDQEKLRSRVGRAVSGQFDPVAAALGYIDDRLYGPAARLAAGHYTGTALGNNPARWAGIWQAQGGDLFLREPAEVQEIRLAALQSLSDMGAEGQPELLEAILPLLQTEDRIVEQAAFETLALMCRAAFANFGPLMELRFDAEDAVEAESWRYRLLNSSADLIRFVHERAGERLLQGGDPSVFGTAAGCLGAAMSFPADFPDPGFMLAELRREGTALLEQMLFMPELIREQRAELVKALGEIGSERAAAAIAAIIESPYCSPEQGLDGMRLAEACADALWTAATGTHAGVGAAREILLTLLRDAREFEPLRQGAPPVGLAHMVLWRLQRQARTHETSLDPDGWRMRLGW